MYTCGYVSVRVYKGVCVSLSISMCVHANVCVVGAVCTHVHVQGSFRLFQCEQTLKKSGQYFLQLLPSPSKQTNKIIPTSIYGASNTRAPPHQHLEKLRPGQFRALWKNEGSGAERMSHMRMTVLQKHFLFFDAPNNPDRRSQTELWPLALRKPRLRGDMIGPESPSQGAKADYGQALSVQGS